MAPSAGMMIDEKWEAGGRTGPRTTDDENRCYAG